MSHDIRRKIKPNMNYHKIEYLEYMIMIKENKLYNISINQIKTKRYIISLSKPSKLILFFQIVSRNIELTTFSSFFFHINLFFFYLR